LRDEENHDTTVAMRDSTPEEDNTSVNQGSKEVSPKLPSSVTVFAHILQFCHLCHKKKVTPVLYSGSTSAEMDRWFESVSPIALNLPSTRLKCHTSVIRFESESDDSLSSPDQKVSRKDLVFINTMLKVHDSMDKSYREKSDKEPGFSRLEEHQKNLILNASALPPFTNGASRPSESFNVFLAKKSQFKAKDMIIHHLQTEKVSFNPSSSFINNLWNCEFFWLLPDTPSGVSIFFCPETKSSNVNEIEKERLLALANKVNASDIEKLSKQKLYIPNTIMDLVLMTQNFYSIVKFCFGQSSHSASFSRTGLITCTKIILCIQHFKQPTLIFMLKYYLH